MEHVQWGCIVSKLILFNIYLTTTLMSESVITKQIPVKGMNCASCAITIGKTLKKCDGVINADVNFGNEKANITFDSSKISVAELSSKIEPLGYSLVDETHVMNNGTVMGGSQHNHSGMDHSAHLGLNQSKQDKINELKEQKRKVLVSMPAALVTFFLMSWEILAMSIQNFPMFPIPQELFRGVLLVLSAIILFWIGAPFLKEVITFARYKVANMYTLVGIGTFTAFAYSAFIVIFPAVAKSLSLSESVYFDVVIVVTGFIYFGKYLETRSKLITGEAIEKLINLQTKTAIVERDGKEFEVKIEDVKIDDILIVKPGGKIPVDGVITEGNSSIDESMITGESIPVDKTVASFVIGSTMNKQGSFKFRATKIGSETLLSQIIKMVDQAQGSKAPIQRLADKISEYFVPAVLIISVVTLIVWLIVGSFFMPFNQALSFGLICFTGVLVIACPCALGLATPTAIIVATGKGAQNGILIKDAESLEKLAKVTTIVTDKTGTITNGKTKVTDVIPFEQETEEAVLQMLASLEVKSEHPIAKAIITEAETRGLKILNSTEFQIIEGKGLNAIINNNQYYAGNKKLIQDLSIQFDHSALDKFTEQGKTPVILVTSKKVLGIVFVADYLKENVPNVIHSLHKQGLKVVMLTGDNSKTAKYIANQAGIDNFYSEVLPADKANIIKELQQKGEVVAMLGDGVNDAPALAQSDVGIAMGTGTDVAIESASITLLKGDFAKVLSAVKLSKITLRVIKENLFWAFAYNILGIPIAAGLFYPFFGLLLSPIFAGTAMALSSVTVVANSIRLKAIKI